VQAANLPGVRSLPNQQRVAFARLVTEQSGRLQAVARRILRDPDAALDAVQDGLLAAWRALERFESRSGLGTWVHRIVVNAALLRLKQRAAGPVSMPNLSHVEKALIGPAESLSRQEEQERAVRAACSLPRGYRQVLRLRCLEERSTEAVASALRLSRGAVKVRLSRGLTMLREQLGAA
jgi:RNA polymerase sigma-70 factor (ECF subfamily)